MNTKNCLLILVALGLLTGCYPNETAESKSENNPMGEKFDDVYSDWKKKEVDYRHYSKTQPLKKLPEYQAFLKLGKESIPLVANKVRGGDGLDFVLCDIIVELSGWNQSDFSETDIGLRSRQVLEKFDQENE